jgi:hypothetical protein
VESHEQSSSASRARTAWTHSLMYSQSASFVYRCCLVRPCNWVRDRTICIIFRLLMRVYSDKLTVMAATFHSAPILGINLCALLRPSLTPVRSLMVKGISPRARFIPTRIFPSLPAASSTVGDTHRMAQLSTLYLNLSREKNVRAEPLPVRKTRSIGHPQFRSTKSIPLLHSFANSSAVGTSVVGLLPATCTPNIVSDGCRLTKDHSSLEAERKEVARPTNHFEPLAVVGANKHSLSPHVLSAPNETQSRLNGWKLG